MGWGYRCALRQDSVEGEGLILVLRHVFAVHWRASVTSSSSLLALFLPCFKIYLLTCRSPVRAGPCPENAHFCSSLVSSFLKNTDSSCRMTGVGLQMFCHVLKVCRTFLPIQGIVTICINSHFTIYSIWPGHKVVVPS